MEALDHEKCLRLMTEILGLLKTKGQYEEVFHFIVDRIVRLFRCQTCAIILIDPKTEYLKVENSFGLSLTFRKEFQRKLATGAIGQLLWTGKRILIPDSAADPGLASEVQLELPFGSCICLQIAVNHRTLGYLHVDAAEPKVLDETAVPVLQILADLAGIAYLKARLLEDNMRLDRVDHETELEKYVPFLERLGEYMERAAQANEPFAVMISDVDNFKSTALTYGYDASHRMLGEMATVIKGQLRTIDAAGRYGFDEFILLRANVRRGEATEFARSLGKAVAGAAYTKEGISSSVSTGVAIYPEDGTTVEELVLAAKYATFEAQRSGRNSVVLYSKD